MSVFSRMTSAAGRGLRASPRMAMRGAIGTAKFIGARPRLATGLALGGGALGLSYIAGMSPTAAGAVGAAAGGTAGWELAARRNFSLGSDQFAGARGRRMGGVVGTVVGGATAWGMSKVGRWMGAGEAPRSMRAKSMHEMRLMNQQALLDNRKYRLHQMQQQEMRSQQIHQARMNRF